MNYLNKFMSNTFNEAQYGILRLLYNLESWIGPLSTLNQGLI